MPVTYELYNLSLHDALPISIRERGECPHEDHFRRQRHPIHFSNSFRLFCKVLAAPYGMAFFRCRNRVGGGAVSKRCDSSSELRSEEHTSELQSHSDLVCRLL